MKAKKKSISMIACIIILITCYIFSPTDINNRPLNNLLQYNLEALAEGEGGGFTDWNCAGFGELDCPDGKKVASYVIAYSLDIYE